MGKDNLRNGYGASACKRSLLTLGDIRDALICFSLWCSKYEPIPSRSSWRIFSVFFFYLYLVYIYTFPASLFWLSEKTWSVKSPFPPKNIAKDQSSSFLPSSFCLFSAWVSRVGCSCKYFVPLPYFFHPLTPLFQARDFLGIQCILHRTDNFTKQLSY